LMRTFGESGGERWVGAGTCAEYDWRAGGECDEVRTPLRPATLYGASKHALAELQSHLAVRLGMSFAWGRIFHLYGPGEPPQRLVPAVIRSLLAGSPAALTHGAQVRDFTHAEDVSAAFVSILGSDCEGALNIGSGERTTVRNVAEIIGNILSRKELLNFGAIDAGAEDPLKLVPAVDRLRSTGFVPRWSLGGGLEDAVRWWRLRSG
jgi:nucleoside-diphosphate-sugar epimerase